MVTRPRAAASPPACVVARDRGVALEQRMLGLGIERRGRLVEHEQQRRIAHEPSRQGELLPLPERDVDAVRPGRAELGVETGLQPRHHIIGAGALDGGEHRRLVVHAGQVADADASGGRGTRT